MKDLLVHVADADAQAFLRSILVRHEALGIREISFDIYRHPQRDAGMVQSGAELARMRKRDYEKALLLLDHHGSGRERRQTAAQVAEDLQRRLDSFTWRDSNAVAVLEPELESWLWFCEPALLAHLGIQVGDLDRWIEERAIHVGSTTAALKRTQPKELFEHILREKIRRTISPRDFEEIGRRAGIQALLACDSFRMVAGTLRSWFPYNSLELAESKS